MAGFSLRAITPSAALSAEHARRRIAPRLLPFLFVLYIANYLDRTSVAYAAIGMARDLGFNDHVLGMGIGIFFVSYVTLQIPGALLVERWCRHPKRVRSSKPCHARQRVDHSHCNRGCGFAKDFRWNRPECSQKCHEHTNHAEP